MRQRLETEQKALEINLDPSIYGTFAEIGAGQEVARYFFQVGGAAGTIAKTMSAYDKVYSDKIYGPEESGRYVCESRLYKMLDHEYELMEHRLQQERPNTNFFAFADTVSAINFQRTIKGNGWLGIRFQLSPGSLPNDLVLHARMLDNDNHLQQQAIGILGVNLIYACFRYHSDPDALLQSLLDGLHGRIKIDMVRLTGPDFEELDNRLLSLKLIKHGLTNVAIFGADGHSLHASEFLYKKHLMVVRTAFQPPTLYHTEMINQAYLQFRGEPEVEVSKTYLLTEIPYDHLCDAETRLPDEKDFLDRAILLNALGHTVMLTRCQEIQDLMDYLDDYKVAQLALVLEARNLLELINEKYYAHLDGQLIAAFGKLFAYKVRYYAFPSLQEGSAEYMTGSNLPVPEGVRFLYKHLIENRQINDIRKFDPGVLDIFTQQVLEQIQKGEKGWEAQVPPKVSKIIKASCLFGYPAETLEFDY